MPTPKEVIAAERARTRTNEERTQRAIQITRNLLPVGRVSLSLLVEMTMYGVTPEDIENTVVDILAYLEKTEPEEAEEN